MPNTKAPKISRLLTLCNGPYQNLSVFCKFVKRKNVPLVLKTTSSWSFHLRWPNTVFDTCVSFTFFSKTLDPLVAKTSSEQVNNTNLVFFYSEADVCAVAMAT